MQSTADCRQNRFKIHYHFVSENENFAENRLFLPTQLKVLSISCCLCYRKQNGSGFTVCLSFKTKCMTGFLSLLTSWLTNKSPLRA